MDGAGWERVLSIYGLPTLALIAMSLGLWKVIRWAGERVNWFMENVLKPLGDQHIATMKHVDACLDMQTTAIEKIQEALENHEEDLKAIKKLLEARAQ